MLSCDTSGLLAFFDASDRYHAPAAAAVDADRGPFVVSPYVVAELDHLIARRGGPDAEVAVLSELAGGAWELPSIGPADMRELGDIVRRYGDQEIGVADACLALLAHRYRTDRLLTLDHHHFRVLRTVGGEAFTLLPAD